MMGAEIFEYEDIAWQTTPPPARYPVPARYARHLAVGSEVTIGIPDRYFIDGQILLRPEPELHAALDVDEPRECLGVWSPLYYWTAQVSPEHVPIMQWWPLDQMWVYEDAAPALRRSPEVADEPTRSAARSWLDRVRADASMPPVLNAVPARDVGALTGRTLRSRNAAGEWFWFIAVSEPVGRDGDICVNAVPPSHWWLNQVRYAPELAAKVRVIPLHRLFAYV